jgi:hypothetical protein
LIEYLLGFQSIYNKRKIGDYLVASPRIALKILNSSNSNFEDQSAAQLFAAKLNVVNGGASNCISETISSANALLKTSMNEELYNQMLTYHDRLESYNNMGCRAQS